MQIDINEPNKIKDWINDILSQHVLCTTADNGMITQSKTV